MNTQFHLLAAFTVRLFIENQVFIQETRQLRSPVISNITKHSNGDAVRVSLSQHGEGLEMRITTTALPWY